VQPKERTKHPVVLWFIHFASKVASHVGRRVISVICIVCSIRQIYNANFKLLLSLAMLRKGVCVMQQEVQGLRSKCPKVEATKGKDDEHEVHLKILHWSAAFKALEQVNIKTICLKRKT